MAIITPPLIVAGALGLDIQTTSYLVSMSLFVSGIATFIQCKRVGPAGCGLLCVQGTSFSFISPIIMAGAIGGLPAIFGATMVGALAEVFISRILKYAMKIITPLVSGIVVTLIGMSLIKVGITSCGGGTAALENGTFGSFQNLVIAISFSMGLGVELYPEILSQFPETIKNIFSSGITTGGLAAIISNMVIRIKDE